MDRGVICDVVAIVAERRGEEWHEPYCTDPKLLEIIELLFKSWKITDSIPVAIVKSAGMHFVDDRVLVPERIPIEWQTPSPGIMSILSAAQGKTQVYMK